MKIEPCEALRVEGRNLISIFERNCLPSKNSDERLRPTQSAFDVSSLERIALDLCWEILFLKAVKKRNGRLI